MIEHLNNNSLMIATKTLSADSDNETNKAYLSNNQQPAVQPISPYPQKSVF